MSGYWVGYSVSSVYLLCVDIAMWLLRCFVLLTGLNQKSPFTSFDVLQLGSMIFFLFYDFIIVHQKINT